MSPSRTLEPKQRRSRETRQRLLDAAVEELIENGYAGFTGGGVAQRAGISRGAAQNHFPQRTTLIVEAVRHLGRLQAKELAEALGTVPGRGTARLRTALDVIFAQYGSVRFAAIIELSLAAREEPELNEVISKEERAISAELTELASEVFGPEKAKERGHRERWATALSTVRGLALLKLLGHPAKVVDRQWIATRRQLVALFDEDPR